MRALRLALLAICLGLGFVGATPPLRARAAVTTYVDRRVSALPAQQLMTADPRHEIDERRQQIAGTLVLYRHLLFFVWAFSQIYVLYLVWTTGFAARMRDTLRRIAPNPVVLRFLYGVGLALIAGLASVPASLAQYRVGLVFDQTSEAIGPWLRDGLMRLSLDAIAFGLVVALVLSLVDRTRQWWIYSIFALFAASIGVGFLEPMLTAPLFNRYEPVPAASTLAAPLHELAARAGVPNAPFYVADLSRQTDLPGAFVLGFGAPAHIVLGDTLIDCETPGEILFAAARQLDFYRRANSLRSTYVFTLLFVLSIAVGVLVTERVRFRSDDDPLSRLALVAAFAGIAGLLAYPVYNGYSRHIERKADAFAVALTGDPASAVRSFVRSADRRFVPLCTPRVLEIYFSTEPSLGTRIASATGGHNPCR